MNILHVIDSLNPADGGPPSVVVQLASAQALLGHRVHIMSFNNPVQFLPKYAHIKGSDKLQFIDVPQTRKAPIDLFFTSDLHKYFPSNTEFIHGHGNWYPLVIATCRSARKANIPYTIAPHGMLDHWCMQQKKLKKSISLKLGLRNILNKSAFIHCLNKHETIEVAKNQITAPLKTIPNGIDLTYDEIENITGTLDQSISHLLNSGPTILFLSRIHYKKGLDYLVNSFDKALPNLPSGTNLIIAGPGSNYLNELNTIINSLNAKPHIHLIGPVYGSAKFELIRKASCFALTSRQEGFSVAILEALTCKTPVIVSHDCHFPELEQHNAGICVPLDTDIIAQALVNFFNDPQLAQTLQANAYNLVNAQYQWRHIAQTCIDLYTTN
ncbi:GDP-mannose-dependent alpha-(1-6)-phosphatidylinositol monomannoside mannosyltransferase [Poriferisphaera corsica]|uniref:GDP-mannose-dependent alpha-(1-6)-phosphatidylinositol monomannoside mannosyltransferase n=1 Tax=Poriferisphaera corsica TaxID=2528020 RepID=A0A517YSC4_9BACT|nr:glycosyltransferase [Poriferisphaera corsica]QDU33125.1 GDP-mannose-dependent alpha-(1-6)-phosphatidylinositol monomannoside mannosyltransferase [Poriferisphaera corsica]